MTLIIFPVFRTISTRAGATLGFREQRNVKPPLSICAFWLPRGAVARFRPLARRSRGHFFGSSGQLVVWMMPARCGLHKPVAIQDAIAQVYAT